MPYKDPAKAKASALRSYHKNKHRYKERIAAANRVLTLARHGLTETEYEAMVLAQEGRCGLCRGEPNGRWKRLAVDHDHETGQLRALLCDNCNRGLGYLLDDPELLRQAAEYIERHKNLVRS